LALNVMITKWQPEECNDELLLSAL